MSTPPKIVDAIGSTSSQEFAVEAMHLLRDSRDCNQQLIGISDNHGGTKNAIIFRAKFFS